MPPTDYVIRGGAAGRDRLRILSRVMHPTTCALLERVGVRPGMACLDVGSGGGDASFELARMTVPGGRVVGVDMDATKVELATTEAAALGLASVEFHTGTVEQLARAATFDVAYARFLLTHVEDPAAVLGRMLAALRPGGVVVVEDVDFTGIFCHPDSAAHRRFVELYTQVVQRRGGDPNIGPRLPGLLLDAGCANVQMHVVQPAGFAGEVKLIAPITMASIADAVLADRLASQREIDEIVRELYALAEDGRTVMSIPRVVQAWGER